MRAETAVESASGEEAAPESGRSRRGDLARVVKPAGRAVTQSGASAEVTLDGGHETIEIRDARRELLFSYTPETGRCVLSAPTGDLVLAAPNGSVDIASGGRVRVHAASGLELRGGASTAAPTLALSEGGTLLRAPSLTIAAERAEVAVGEGTYRGIHLEVVADRVRTVAGRLESIATSVVSRARRVVRRVDEVELLTAGRLRTLVAGAFTIKAHRAALDAEDDVKIQGKRIHLG